MKKIICMLLCLVLFWGIVSPSAANESLHLEDVLTEKSVKPIAYTHDFDGYSNMVGVLNSDGTKTVYLFASNEQAEQIDSLTGLVSTQEERLQRNSVSQSRGIYRPTIVDAPVYSARDDRNYGTEASMIIGTTTAYGVGRVYMKFDISSLDSVGIAYTDILSACLYFTESTTIENGTKSVIQAYLVSGEWEEDTITWENSPDYYGYEMIGCANVGTCDEVFATQITDQLYITKAIMAWMQGMDNNGILLKEKDDRYDNRFYTSDWPIANKQPYITVTYANDSAYTLGQGIVNNTKYYIVNKETGKYLTATSTSTGTAITQEDFLDTYETTQQWKFTATSSVAGYKIMLANTNKCLKNSSTALNNPVVLGTTATTTAQTWRLFRNWNGTYRFHSKVTSFGAVKVNGTASGIIQDEYLCDFDHSDEWTLIPVAKGQASFFDFDIDIDTTYGTGTMASLSGSAGYSSATRTTNSPVTDIDDIIQNSSLFYFSGHGKQGKLCFYTAKDIRQGDLIVCDNIREQTTDISMEDWESNSLAQSQLIILSSCLSGANPINNSNSTIGYNMTGRLYWLGAHNVVSYFNATTPGYDLAWNSAFMTDVLLGRSLKTAKMRADNHLYDDYFMDLAVTTELAPYGNTNERHDLGDENYIPGFTVANASAKNNYNYQGLPSLSFSSTIQNYSIMVLDEDLTVVDPIFRLPKDSIDEHETACYSNIFDAYMDEYGGIYWYYTDRYGNRTNVLHSYEPYTENLKIGNGIVNQQMARNLADDFLSGTGYLQSLGEYEVKTSNNCSKDYIIEFVAKNGHKKLVFHMQAEEWQNNQPGRVYINSFAAYVANYDGIGGW